jgi:hypothetical protein
VPVDHFGFKFMKPFRCDVCGNTVFFQNCLCLQCGTQLGFLADQVTLASLHLVANSGHFIRVGNATHEYRPCDNGVRHQLCNWMVPADQADPLCPACRMTEMIPDLSVPGNLDRWRKLELAKRRCLYTLLRLGLPTGADYGSGKPPLRFRFLADTCEAGQVMTGHDWGEVTLNIAEADDDERERRRINFREPHRTLIGHFRHELGHFYWDHLIAGTWELSRFRELFGDETIDYGGALQTYYAYGPAANWTERTVTAYASAHPWEDWAETWAHYLHLFDSMETAAAYGLKLGSDSPINTAANEILPPSPHPDMDFDAMWQHWHPFTLALNSINRGMGLPDLYPFVVPQPAVEKLRFVHEVIRRARTASQTSVPKCSLPTHMQPFAVGT